MHYMVLLKSYNKPKGDSVGEDKPHIMMCGIMIDVMKPRDGTHNVLLHMVEDQRLRSKSSSDTRTP
jgi:hypothetical protein